MTKHTADLNQGNELAIPEGVPMGFPMLPPEMVQFMNRPEVVALATALQLSTPVVAVALAAKRWLLRKTPHSGEQNRDARPPVAEIVEYPDEIVVRYHSREVRFPRDTASKIFKLFLSLDPHQGAPKPPDSADTQ